MGVGILNLIRIMESLQGNLSDWTEEGGSTYIFDYQAAERVCDKDDRAITLYESEILNEFPDDRTHRILPPHSRQFLHQID